MTGTNWAEQAACRAVDPDRMHPDEGDHAATQEARRICHTCPVQAACLRQALTAGEPHGMWGGFTELERPRLRAGVAAKLCADCGMWFVPRAREERCTFCVLNDAGNPSDLAAHGQTLTPYRDLVAQLAAGGMSDVQIGAQLGVSSKRVYRARDRWNIPAGRTACGPHMNPADLAPCGTPTAIRRHCRRGEPLDEACRTAARERRRAERARAKAAA